MFHRRATTARHRTCRPGLRTAATALAAAATLAGTAAQAAPVSYVGEDAAGGSAAAMPHALAAQADFLARLAISATDSLESRPSDATISALSFSALGVLGTLSAPTTVRGSAAGGAFATAGSKYLRSTETRRIQFSSPVAAFGVFVTDAGDHDNDPATVTVGGQPLDAAQRAARPAGGEVDEVLRVYTERPGGTLELLFSGGSLPAASGGALFIGLVDVAQPFTNIVLLNGAAGLDSLWNDGFGFDQFTVGAVAAGGGTVPEPAGLALLALAAAGLAGGRRRAG